MTRWRNGLALAAAAASAAALLTGCGPGDATPGSRAPASPSAAATAPGHRTAHPSRHHSPKPSASASAPGPAARPAGVTKLLVFVVENHSLDQMRDTMPFTFGLARRYGYATSYTALTHPSLPNYLAMAGGSTFGVTDDESPASHVIHAPSVFGQALALGRTAKVYAEAMPGRCTTSPAAPYAVKHNPWAYFADERTACERYDVPLDGFAADAASGRLPDAGMVIPDLCHDAHDCGLAVADDWLRERVAAVLAGPDWRAGRLVVVVTADEDDHSQGNRVLTAVLHPSVRGAVVEHPLTHYSLTRAYAEVLGARPLGRAADAPSLVEAFGLGSLVAGLPPA